MFSPKKVNSPLGSSFDEPTYKNQSKIKNLQVKYLNDGMQKSLKYQKLKQSEEKFIKERDTEAYIRQRDEYINNLSEDKLHKSLERSYLASQYDDHISERKSHEKNTKRNQLLWEKSLLAQPTWIRDEEDEKRKNKSKMMKYNEELQNHIKQQEKRKRNEKQEERRLLDKLNAENQEIIKREYQQREEKSKKKSLFQQKQNKILGIQQEANNFDDSLDSNIDYDQNKRLKRSQQSAYGAGLGWQVDQLEQKRRKREVDHHFYPSQSYNPITNPIPRVYKNPVILKVFGT